MNVQLADVLRAIESDQITPFFQPLVELRTGKLTGFEVLARWEQPGIASHLPRNFISLAEENGLIGALANQIYRKAFQLVSELPAPLTLSLNVSPAQLHHSSLPEQIRTAAEDAGFPLDQLTIEITETALASDLQRSQKIARKLKDMGCKLSLDDFGTGYSSLGSLHALPFDELKIDRSFVGSMTERRESRKIVAAIAGLGSSLGVMTVGEGVETEEQAEMLLLFSCTRAQGWLYGKAVPASEVPGLVAAPAWEAPCVHPELTGRWEGSSLEALPTQRLSQLQAIYDGAPAGLGFLDLNLRYVNLNRRLAEMNGFPVSKHLGRSVEELIPDIYPNISSYLLRALGGEAVSGVEVPRPPSYAGGPAWTSLVSYHPARDEAGEVIGVSIAVVDMSEQKATEEALQESVFLHQHMSAICRQVPWSMDGQGKNLQVGSQPPFAENSEEDPVQHPEWLGDVHADDRESTIKTMRIALRKKQHIDVEYRVLSADRGWRWMRCRASPRLGPKGEVLRWYGGVEDVDDFKRMERERDESLATLTAIAEALPTVFAVEAISQPSARVPVRREKAMGTKKARKG
jgi:PAS domain S-box-containing protein